MVVAAAAEPLQGQEQQDGQQQQEQEQGKAAAAAAVAAAVAEGAHEEEDDEDDEDADVPAWAPGRDPLPPTLDVSVACGDVVEEGAEGYEVLLLVSAAFTDALLQTVARALDPLPVGTVVRVAFLRSCGVSVIPFPSLFLIYQNQNETHTHRPSASPRAFPAPSGRCCTTRRARSRGAAPGSSSSGRPRRE